MPDVALDLSQIANGVRADATPVRAAFTALQEALNGLDGDNLTDAVAAMLGLTSSSGVRRGKSIIPAAETRTNAAFGLMPTPDRVQNVVLPTDGLIFVAYQATWQESVSTNAQADIFLNNTEIRSALIGSVPQTVSTAAGLGGTAGKDRPLHSYPFGLMSAGGAANYLGDVTTGQVVGADYNTASDRYRGGPCMLFAAAGTYDVSVQFMAVSGSSVTVKNRRLWVWTMGF